MKKQLGALIVTITLTLSAVGCTTAPDAKKTPTPSAASTQSAQLAAAIDAFTVFNAVLDGYVGGTRPVDDFKSLVTPEYFTTLVSEDETRDTSTRTVGASSFGDEKLVDPDEWGGYGDLSLVVCLDLSRTHVETADGNSTTPTSRRTQLPVVVFFEERSEDHALLVNKVDQWNESGYCS